MQKTLWKNCGSLFRSMSFLFSGTNNWVDQKEDVHIWKGFSFYICIRLERNANPIFGELFCLRVDLELSYRAHKRSAKVQDLIGFNVKSGVNWSKAGLWGKEKKKFMWIWEIRCDLKFSRTNRPCSPAKRSLLIPLPSPSSPHFTMHFLGLVSAFKWG